MIFLLKTRYLGLDARQKRNERSVAICTVEAGRRRDEDHVFPNSRCSRVYRLLVSGDNETSAKDAQFQHVCS